MLNQVTQNTTNFNPYVFFIIYNAMGESFNKLSEIFLELKNCQLDRLNSLNTLKIELLIAGIIILCATFLALAAYLFFIDKQLNIIWELLRIRVRSSFFDLKENINARLDDIHGKDDFLEIDVDSRILKNKEPLKFRHSLRTISRFSIIFITAAIFILMQCLIFEQNLQNTLWNHPIFMSDIMSRKFLLARISYYVLESRFGSNDNLLNNIYPYYNTISNPQNEVLKIYHQLNILIDKLRDD